MTARRFYRYALFGALVALAPAIAIGSSADTRPTEALPMFPAPDKASLPVFDLTQLKSGLDALTARNFAAARR